MSSNLIISLICYIALTLLFGFLSKKHTSGDFFTNHYLGGRSLGYFALSMTIFASYVSSGTFLAGVGASYKFGFAWLWIGPIQVVSVVFIFYVIGTKLQTLSKQHNAITVPELFRCCYKSKYLGLFSSFAIMVFMPFMLMAQWQGGAYLVKNILNIDYKTSLILFSVFVGTYTVFGGFKWVVATDILQGVLMFLGSLFIYFGVVNKGLGLNVITTTLKDLESSFISSSGYLNALSPSYIISFWFLVGVGLLGLPQIILRFMAFKDKASLNKATILTPIMVLVLMVSLNASGIYTRAILPNFSGNTDSLLTEILPLIFNNLLTSFVLVAIFSSIVSTADSVLLTIISAFNYDLLTKHLKVKPNSFWQKSLFNKLSGMAIVFLIAFFGSYMKKDILYLNFLGFGALQTAFFMPVCLLIFGNGKVNKNLAGSLLLNVVLSVVLYSLLFVTKPSFLFNFHPVVYSILFSILFYFASKYFLKTWQRV